MPTKERTTTVDVVVAALPSRTLRALGDVETVARVVREVFDASDFHDDFNADDDDADDDEGRVAKSKTATTTPKWMPLVDALKTRTSVDAAREALRIGRALSRGKRARVDAEGVGGRMTTTMKPTTSSRFVVDRLGEGLVTCARCSRAVYADRHAEHLKYRCDGGASAVGRDATTTKSTTKSTAMTTTTTGGVVVHAGASDTAPRERAKSASVAASSAKQRQNASGAAGVAARHVPTPLAVRVSVSDARRAHDAIVFAGMCRAKTKIGDAFADAVRDDS